MILNSIFTGKHIIKLPVIDSTNNYAMEMLSANLAYDGTVIVADHQKLGRGQRGASWMSAPGENLTFSIIYFPSFLTVDKMFYLSVITSLGLMKTLKHYNIDASIKWPNDMYSGTKKIAGILIENNLNGPFLKHSIIGIGLNINQENFPGLNATSIRNESGLIHETRLILDHLIVEIEKYYLKLRKGDFQELLSCYYKYMKFYNQPTSVKHKGELKEVLIKGVSPTGLLEFEHEGIINFADLKEISFEELGN